MMRKTLPGGNGNSQPASAFEVFASGGSEALADLVRQQEEADADRMRRQDDEARARYEHDLEVVAQRRREMGLPPLTPNSERDMREIDADVDLAVRQKTFEREDAAIMSTTPHPFDVAIAKPIEQPAPRPTLDVRARPCTAQDADRLWDWLRSEQGKGDRFLGRSFSASVDLHHHLAALHLKGGLRAVDVNGTHAGFFLLNPIDTHFNIAMLHIYAAPIIRGETAQLVFTLWPYVLREARAIIPPTMKLGIHTWLPDEAMTRLVVPYGFTRFVTFVQEGKRDG
jgi:hypothetical protein